MDLFNLKEGKEGSAPLSKAEEVRHERGLSLAVQGRDDSLRFYHAGAYHRLLLCQHLSQIF